MTDAAATFQLDGHDVPFAPGQSILAAAQAAGHYIPHLCYHPEFAPHGSCKVCTVKVNGHTHASCTTPAHAGDVVESATDELTQLRLNLVQFLFTEGNHFCPSCEKSGDCRLQDAGYAFGLTGPGFEEFHPHRPVDASHPEIWLDLNRCILCKLCLRASSEVDGKDVFAIGGHGIATRLIVDSPSGRLGDSALAAADLAAHICPVGAILPKRRGFAVPIGARPADARAAVAAAADPRAGDA